MTGGDLRFHISRKTFTEDAVQFWIAELGCALRYIHKKGIVHRDVKPDNVLLDSEGHVHLADFVSFTRRYVKAVLIFLECCVRFCAWTASHEQIGNISVSRSRGLCW